MAQSTNMLPAATQGSEQPKSHPPLWHSVLTVVLSTVLGVLGGVGTVVVSGHWQDENAQRGFMRTERSVVYAEYLESAVRYQNELNDYITIIPYDDINPRAFINDEASRASFSEVKAARENYVNKRTRARILQDADANEPQRRIDELLFSAHDQLQENKTKNLQGRTDGMTNDQMREITGGEFNSQLDSQRNAYVEAVRKNFHEESSKN